MEKKLKESYDNNELHNELINKIRDFVKELPEFDVTQFYLCESEKEKAFGVITDNGHGNVMKRFRIIVKDLKSK